MKRATGNIYTALGVAAVLFAAGAGVGAIIDNRISRGRITNCEIRLNYLSAEAANALATANRLEREWNSVPMKTKTKGIEHE